jgi:hypothetical protein
MGTLYFKIESSGSAVASISDVTVTSQTTGYAVVSPRAPSSLGPGTFTSTISVRACTTDPDCSSTQLHGSPSVVNVTYRIDHPSVMDDPAKYHITGWQPMRVTIGADHPLAAIGDALYSVGLSDMTRSVDYGVSWRAVPAAAPTTSLKDFAVASDGTAIFLSGGVDADGLETNQVWRFDGAVWTQKAANPALPPRVGHSMVAHAGALFVLGGRSRGVPLNDVWSSRDDGVTWNSEATSPFTPRYNQCAVSLGGALFVLGGVGDYGEGEVWTSVDGKVWSTIATLNRLPFFSTFEGQTRRCAVVGDRMYYVGDHPSNSICLAAAASSADGSNWQFEAAPSYPFPTPGAAVIGTAMFVSAGVGTSQPTVFRSLP